MPDCHAHRLPYAVVLRGMAEARKFSATLKVTLYFTTSQLVILRLYQTFISCPKTELSVTRKSHLYVTTCKSVYRRVHEVLSCSKRATLSLLKGGDVVKSNK